MADPFAPALICRPGALPDSWLSINRDDLDAPLLTPSLVSVRLEIRGWRKNWRDPNYVPDGPPVFTLDWGYDLRTFKTGSDLLDAVQAQLEADLHGFTTGRSSDGTKLLVSLASYLIELRGADSSEFVPAPTGLRFRLGAYGTRAA